MRARSDVAPALSLHGSLASRASDQLHRALAAMQSTRARFLQQSSHAADICTMVLCLALPMIASPSPSNQEPQPAGTSL